MSLGWKPDTAVVMNPRCSPTGCCRYYLALLLSHSFIDPFHDPQNVAPNTISRTFMVSLGTEVADPLFSIEQSAQLMRESLLVTHMEQIDDEEVYKCAATN